jgi:opacity protein-like surface antigen
MRHSVLVAAILAAGMTAFAQVGEISVSGGAGRFGGGSPGTVDTSASSGKIDVSGGVRLDIRLTLNSYKFFGHEFGYGYSRSTYKAPDDVPVPIHQGYYDFLVYATPEGTKVRPFGAGGVQFSSFFPPGASASYGNQITKFGINYGGGIKVKVSPMMGIRFDFRQYNSGHPFEFSNRSGRLLQTAITGGVSINF